MRKQKASETRFFIDFCWVWEASWPSKTQPRRSKINVERASKFDQFLKASWNTIFSAQEPPRRPSAANRRRRWSRPEATGGGFRRGKTRTSEKKNPERDEKKNPETWIQPSSTPSPVGRRIASRIPPGQDNERHTTSIKACAYIFIR